MIFVEILIKLYGIIEFTTIFSHLTIAVFTRRPHRTFSLQTQNKCQLWKFSV